MSTPSYPFQPNNPSAPGGGFTGQAGSTYTPSNVTQSSFMTIPQAAPPGQAAQPPAETMQSTGYVQSSMYPQSFSMGGGMPAPSSHYGGQVYGMGAPTGMGQQPPQGMMVPPGFAAGPPGSAGMYSGVGGMGMGAPGAAAVYLEMPCPKCKTVLQIAPHIAATYCVKCKVNHGNQHGL
jgi:phage FluMu protein Com